MLRKIGLVGNHATWHGTLTAHSRCTGHAAAATLAALFFVLAGTNAFANGPISKGDDLWVTGSGACCNPSKGFCTIAQKAADCNGVYMGDGTDCRDDDGDGIANVFETNDCTDPNRNPCRTGTDPNNPDTDGDGWSDGFEVRIWCDPCVFNVDLNGNGLPDECEQLVKFSQPPKSLPGVCSNNPAVACVVDSDCWVCVGSGQQCVTSDTCPTPGDTCDTSAVCQGSASGEDYPSDLDWPDMDPNQVVADDFVSDGRPITAVRWWGSNIFKTPPDPKLCDPEGAVCGDAALECVCAARVDGTLNCLDPATIVAPCAQPCTSDATCTGGAKCFGEPGITGCCGFNCGEAPTDPKACDQPGDSPSCSAASVDCTVTPGDDCYCAVYTPTGGPDMTGPGVCADTTSVMPPIPCPGGGDTECAAIGFPDRKCVFDTCFGWICVRNCPGVSLSATGDAAIDDGSAGPIGIAAPIRAAQFADLRAIARDQGSVRVIAELSVPNIDALLAASRGARDAAVGAQADGQLKTAIDPVVQAELRKLAGLNYTVNRTYASIPFVALTVQLGALNALEASAVIVGINEDSLDDPSLINTVNIVGASASWAKGADGTGWTVAVLDTGIRATHEFFAGKTIQQACFAKGTSGVAGAGDCPNGSDTQIGGNAAQHHAAAPFSYHGTHVAGIAVGNGPGGPGVPLAGVAKGADLIAVQVFSQFFNTCSASGGACVVDTDCPPGETCGPCNNVASCVLSFASDQIKGLDHVFSLRFNKNIASVNMSLGGGKFNDQAACDASTAGRKASIDNLRGAGIATVIASGNDGNCNGISRPGCISSAIAVGATDDADVEASFSNYDTVGMLDLYAPGVEVLSSWGNADNGYTNLWGTSMATPHVAGAFAIMKQATAGAGVTDIFNMLQGNGQSIVGRCVPVPAQRRIQIDAAINSKTPLPDGWFISFHEPLQENDPQDVPLALYYCDSKVLIIEAAQIPDCQNHKVLEYLVDLQSCCLVHANIDSRTGEMPAMKDAFYEKKNLQYHIDIQAVVGVQYTQDINTGECIEKKTDRSAANHFWGWHTTINEEGKKPALESFVKMVPPPGDEWLYGPWVNVLPKCSFPNMAFELLTTQPPTPGACCDKSQPGGVCTSGVPESLCPHLTNPQIQWFKDQLCIEDPGGTIDCLEHTGACCDKSQPGGVCTSGVPESQCATSDPQIQWFKDQLCVEDGGTINCPEHTGACCDGCTGVCTDGVPQSLCVEPEFCQPSWTKDVDCANVECFEHTGACCLPDGTCIDDKIEGDCDLQGGNWQEKNICADVICNVAGTCIYDNGPAHPLLKAPVSQYAWDVPFFAEAADDFMLKGDPTRACELTNIRWYVLHGMFNPGVYQNTPKDYKSIRVTIYNDTGLPQGQGKGPDGMPLNDGTHIGSVKYEIEVPQTKFEWAPFEKDVDGDGNPDFPAPPFGLFVINMDVSQFGLKLEQNVKYWLAIAPEWQFNAGYFTHWMVSQNKKGHPSQHFFEDVGGLVWVKRDHDLAFRIEGVKQPQTGACCLPDGSCIDGKTEGECDLQGGNWQEKNTCAGVICNVAGTCIYDNGLATAGGTKSASQYAWDKGLFAESADDFTLKGEGDSRPCEITKITWYVRHDLFNPGAYQNTPKDYKSIRVTIYNDTGLPQGQGKGPDGRPLSDGTHFGNFKYEIAVPQAKFEWRPYEKPLGTLIPDTYVIDMDVSQFGIKLEQNVKYWLAIAPEWQVNQGYRTFWMGSQVKSGHSAQEFDPFIGIITWVKRGHDLAFRIEGFKQPPPCLQPDVISGISSRYIQITPNPADPVTPVALRVTNQCTGAQGWVRLHLVDYDDGPQGLVNVGIAEAACNPAEFHTPATWLGTGNKLVVTGHIPAATGDVIAPNTHFRVEAVCGGCPPAATFSTPVKTIFRTWVYSDCSGDGQVTFFADLFKIFSNTAASGFPLWLGPDPGYEVDPHDNALPDQQSTFFTDIFQAFQATAAAGCTGFWGGPTCCAVVPDCHACETTCAAGLCGP
ncbi:MAG: S8 family serine peptidase [Phycisphaerae bacterium]